MKNRSKEVCITTVHFLTGTTILRIEKPLYKEIPRDELIFPL